MKKLMGMMLAFVLVLGLAACGEEKAPAENTDAKTAESIGTVNGKEVSQADYDMFYNMYLDILAKQQRLSENVKSMLVEKSIIEQDLEKNKVKVTEEDIKKSREQMMLDLGATKDDYKEKLAEQGISEEAFEVFVKMRANSEAHMAWFKKEHKVEDKKLAEYYEEHKDELDKLYASHILVETAEEATEIKAKIDEGEDFAALAEEFSTDEMTKIVGGELGEISVKYSGFDEDFMAALQELEVGEVSEPVETQFGFHIIKLTDVKEGADALKDEIAEILFNEEYMKYTSDLRDNAEIKFNDEEVKEEDKKDAEAVSEEAGEAEKPAEDQTEKADDSEKVEDEETPTDETSADETSADETPEESDDK